MYITNRSKIIDCGIAEEAFYRTLIQCLSGVRKQRKWQELLEKKQRIRENPSSVY